MIRNFHARFTSTATSLSVLSFVMLTGIPSLHAQSAQASGQANVAAQLKNPVDSRQAKVGQQVLATTTEKATAQGKELPRGTALLGHVTSVTQHAQGKGDGSVGMLFDQARMKDGSTVPIQSSLRSIAPSPSAQANTQTDAAAGPASAGASGNASANAPARSGGGLLGGVAGGVTSGVASVASGVGNVTKNTVSGVTQTTGTLAKGLVAGVSSVPGVVLGTGTDGSTSGVVSSAGRDVHLDSGTQLTLGVTVQ